MFTIKNIQNVETFIRGIINSDDITYLQNLEMDVENFMNKYEQILFLNNTIEDVLDIRDAIILRKSKLNRIIMLNKYIYDDYKNPLQNSCDNSNYCVRHELETYKKQEHKEVLKQTKN
jgi:hypothetical protein